MKTGYWFTASECVMSGAGSCKPAVFLAGDKFYQN